MIQVTATISGGNQITIPKALREVLNVKPGDELVLEGGKDRVIMKKAMTHEEKVRAVFKKLDEWRDSLPDEAKEKIEEYAGWTANQCREHIDNLPETVAYRKEKYGV